MLVVKELKDYLFMLMIILWVKIKNYDIEIDGRSF